MAGRHNFRQCPHPLKAAAAKAYDLDCEWFSTVSDPNTDRLAQFLDFEFVEFGALLGRFFRAGERLRNGFQAHTFCGQHMKFLNFIMRPGLAMAFEAVGHGGSFLRARDCLARFTGKLARPGEPLQATGFNDAKN